MLSIAKLGYFLDKFIIIEVKLTNSGNMQPSPCLQQAGFTGS
jgi:hypothetical protein